MAELGFDGRVAIVTGAAGGLGRQHALLLARRGARVVVNDTGGAVDGTGGDGEAAAAVAAEIKAAGGEAIADANTVATADGGRGVVQSALDNFGTVDIVVNNAGILRDKTFQNMTDDLWGPVLDVHLTGAFHVAQPAWPIMREKGFGRIVNTSSSSGILGNFGQSNYGAAKMGLVGLTRVLAAEGARYGIQVNAIAPVARTRMTEDLLGPMGSYVDPGEVSPTVAWLCHDECPVSGEVFSVGGGRVARFFIGLTEGWYQPGHGPEDVRDHFEEVRADAGYIIPAGPADEFAVLTKLFGVAT
jgi:NAD(P)-dependent dehydrogenase (short-subunit alcohol dehydrogenase family)